MNAKTVPDIILHNGRITTLDSKYPEATSLAIKDGLILVVDDAEEYQRGPGTNFLTTPRILMNLLRKTLDADPSSPMATWGPAICKTFWLGGIRNWRSFTSSFCLALFFWVAAGSHLMLPSVRGCPLAQSLCFRELIKGSGKLNNSNKGQSNKQHTRPRK